MEVKHYNDGCENLSHQNLSYQGEKMDTFKIKAMLAAVRLGSLSKAAEEFNYTPSAFSHILTSLESELGVSLFVRSSSGVRLTEAGERLLPTFSAMEECEEQLLSIANELSGHASGRLRIATYSSISRNLLSDIIKEFREQNPKTSLTISVLDDLSGVLENDFADIIFSDEITLKNFEWTPIAQDRYFAVMPLSENADGKYITLDELYRKPFIFTNDKSLEPYLDKSRFTEIINLRSEDDLSVVNMVKVGMGSALLPELVIKEMSGGVNVYPVEPPIVRTLGFAYKKGHRTRALSRFIKLVNTARLK